MVTPEEKNDHLQYYCQLATAIIQKQIEIIGSKIALKKAQNVKNILISPDGEVLRIQGNVLEALENLIKEYADISGETAVNFSQQAIAPLIKSHPDWELPLILKEDYHTFHPQTQIAKEKTSDMEQFLQSF